MISASGYQLHGVEGDDGQINYFTFEYANTEVYEGKEYFKYVFAGILYILAPTRNITKVTFPFDGYYTYNGEEIIPLSEEGFDSLYGFTSVPENKVVMKPRTDIGTNANNKAYVDLGLTSGTLWATCNVGASSETDYGSYFQWGDTVDKSNAVCDWSTYKYGDESNFSKYNTGISGYGGTIDNKTTLDLVDDAARVHMGGDWRIPTHALIEELVEETTNEWISNYNGTGVNGRKFTSKANGNSIFIPAAGERSGSSFMLQGEYGHVWSSSLVNYRSSSAWYLEFGSNNFDNIREFDRNRPYGFSVRGVL